MTKSSVSVTEAPQKKIRTALIGVSGFGDRHYRDLLREVEAGFATATAACIINPDEVPEKVAHLRTMGCRIYNCVEDLFAAEAGNLDLVMIPTGIATHLPFTRLALSAGAHVLVEKPAAATVEDVEAMQEAENESGLNVFVGFQHRYDPLTRQIQDALLSGKIGSLQEITCLGAWPRSLGYYQRNSWAGKIRQGNTWVNDAPFNNAFAHDVLTALWFASPEAGRAALPEHVEAELWRAYEIESCDTAFLTIKTDGIPIRLCFSHVSESQRDPRIQVTGEKGVLTWTHKQAVWKDRDGKETLFHCLEGEPLRAAMFKHIRQNICGEDVSGPVCTLDTALSQTRAAILALQHPIQNVNPAEIRYMPDSDGQERPVWNGVDERLDAFMAPRGRALPTSSPGQ